MEDRSCKRCSVSRVNQLVRAYEQAHADGDAWTMRELREVVARVKNRGYPEAVRLLQPGLEGSDLRAFCWNVSSFLEDEELKVIFGRILK